MSVKIFMRFLGSKSRYTFYPAAIGRLVTLRAVWDFKKKKGNSEIKYIATANFVAGS